MNPVISAQLNEFAKNNSLTQYPVDVQFENYTIYSILNGMMGEGIDPYDCHLSGDEFGIDGVAIVIQGESVRTRDAVAEVLNRVKNPSIEFIFFQSKISTNFDYGNISKFYDAINEFFNDQLMGESPEMDELIGTKNAIYEKGVGRKNPKLSCFYVTTGNYEEPLRIERLRNNFSKSLGELNIFDSDHIQLEFIGAKELQKWYRAATSSFEVEFDYSKNVVMPSNDNVVEAYIGYIDAENLLKLFSQKDDDEIVTGINKAVFYDNIRDYDPKSKINIGIKQSVIDSGGAEFVFRNNGITVVSKNIDRTGNKFKIEDYQIVNGCQTSNIIFDLIHGEDKDSIADTDSLQQEIQVPFRLIGSKDDDFVSSIIIGTNRQNPVKDDQFWALRPFMKSFEEYCKSLEGEDIIYFERRDNQYRAQNVERTRIMPPSILMKAVAACFLFHPQRAARDYRGILAEYENAIFLDDHDVRVYHAAAYLHYKLEFLWRNQRISNDYKTFRYYILTGIGLNVTGGQNIFNVKKKDMQLFAKSIVDLAKDEEKLKGEIEKIVFIVSERLEELGVTNQERVRDAIRGETFAIKFKEQILTDESNAD